MRDLLEQALEEPPATEHLEQEVLAAFLDQTLPDEARLSVESHLADCPRCSAEIAAVIHATRPQTPERASPAQRSTHKRFAGWLRLAAALALTTGTLFLGRETGFLLNAELRKEVVAQLEGVTGREVALGRAQALFLGGPGIRLTSLQVDAAPEVSLGTFLSLQSADLRLDTAELLRGNLEGQAQIIRPRLHLVRDAQGAWNVEKRKGGLGRASQPASDVRLLEARSKARPSRSARGGVASADGPQLSVRIIDGTLEVTDEAVGERQMILEGLSLSYQGSPNGSARLSANATMKSTGERVQAEGLAGPFQRGEIPVYHLQRLDIGGVEVQQLPGAPTAVTGRLAFHGTLETLGRSLGQLAEQASASGTMTLSDGSLVGHNLISDFLHALATLPGVRPGAIKRIQSVPVVTQSMRSRDTFYQSASGWASLERSVLQLETFRFETPLFWVETDASISSSGEVQASGELHLKGELRDALRREFPTRTAIPSASRPLRFRLSGTWPALEVEVQHFLSASDDSSSAH